MFGRLKQVRSWALGAHDRLDDLVPEVRRLDQRQAEVADALGRLRDDAEAADLRLASAVDGLMGRMLDLERKAQSWAKWRKATDKQIAGLEAEHLELCERVADPPHTQAVQRLNHQSGQIVELRSDIERLGRMVGQLQDERIQAVNGKGG